MNVRVAVFVATVVFLLAALMMAVSGLIGTFRASAEPWFPFSLFKEEPIDWMDVIAPTTPVPAHAGCVMLMPEAWRCPDPGVQR